MNLKLLSMKISLLFSVVAFTNTVFGAEDKGFSKASSAGKNLLICVFPLALPPLGAFIGYKCARGFQVVNVMRLKNLKSHMRTTKQTSQMQEEARLLRAKIDSPDLLTATKIGTLIGFTVTAAAIQAKR